MNFKPKTKTINVVLMDGGVGDLIASLTPINYVHNQYPWITQLVWMPDYLVDFAKNVLPEGLSIKGFSDMRGQYQPTRPTKTTKWDGVTSPMKIHLVDYAYLKLTDELPGPEHKNYLPIKLDKINGREFGLTNSRYVVLTTGYTTNVREFPASSINHIARWLSSRGFMAVFLGKTQTATGAAHTIKGSFSEEIDYSKGVNLIDKTALLEASAIMHNAKAVVGVDNGLLHVAGCTSAPIVGGFTTVSPTVRMPYRQDKLGFNFYYVTPDESLACKFCQEKTNFLYGHDYRDCMEGTRACVSQMTADKFIAHLENILK